LVRRLRDVVQSVEIGLLNEAVRLVFDERRAVELIAAGLGDRGQDRRRRLSDLGAEILGFDLIFLDGELREWVSDAEVLAENSAVVDRVLEAHPVEQDVGVLRRKSACLELLSAT